MPQVKGSATWLTNVRQMTGQRRVGIDQSEPKIENERMEKDMKERLGSLHLQQHRARADSLYEVKVAKDQVKEYHQMQELAKQNSVDHVLRGRTAETGGISGPRAEKPGVPAKTNMTQLRPSTANQSKKMGSGFSMVHVEGSDDDGVSHKAKPVTSTTKAHTKPGPPPVRARTAHPTGNPRRRPRTALAKGPKNVLDIRRSVQAEFTDKKDTRRTRPHTSLGVAMTGDYDDDNEDEAAPSGGAVYGGRSFQELRQASDIDKILSANKDAKRRLLLAERARMRSHDEEQLEERLQKFYTNLEQFKRSTNKNIYNSFL